MRRFTLALLVSLLLVQSDAGAFCGFFVSKADTKLFNKASQVVIARSGKRTVMTLANDYQGDPAEFAMVIPVPTFIEEGQIHVGDPQVLAHLDAYTSPRLVEYHDPDPCVRAQYRQDILGAMKSAREDASRSRPQVSGEGLGVSIEASYNVGEYEILILSAKESDGLEVWLRKNGYRVPRGASQVLEGYLKQDMRFFVAKVNLKEHARQGSANLRPLQIAFESPKFMLPIRLGMLNANGPQELFVYTLTQKGRVETANYKTTKLPSGVEIPTFVKDEFGEFYRAMFDEQVRQEKMSSVFLEYAWDMGWCDPCAADPLSNEELRSLGVFWLPGGQQFRGGAAPVYVTRMHVRYDEEHFPADLVFQETGDRSNFQGRYVMRQPFAGELTCNADRYAEQVRERQEREVEMLAKLTAWEEDRIRKKVKWFRALSPNPWWEKIWN